MATSIRPHTSSRTSRHLASSPTRPATSHSTIRRVTPSPDSLPEALGKRLAAHSTPRYATWSHDPNQNGMRPVSTSVLDAYGMDQGGKDDGEGEMARPRTDGLRETRPLEPQRPNITRNLTPTRIPQPTASFRNRKTATTADTTTSMEKAGLKRSRTGRISPTKHAAPRKHRPLSMPMPMPLNSNSEDHVRGISSPLKGALVPLVNGKVGENEVEGRKKEQERGSGFTMFPTEDPFITPASAASMGNSTLTNEEADRIEAAPQVRGYKIHRKPLATTTRASPSTFPPTNTNTKTPLHTLTSFPLTHRVSSITSTRTNRTNKTTFSTPGRDEMERKKSALDEFAGDDGPFGRAKDLKGLEERRRKIEDGGKEKTIKLGRKRGEKKEVGYDADELLALGRLWVRVRRGFGAGLRLAYLAWQNPEIREERRIEDGANGLA
ncbi:hypothetical protein K458DRAFT_469585 [Lentithecium fluviatile CBS 122367]|uniref:Uncharacterized protein n=1 Tax=Lentithecium fluviatile CBS 122367 TaxID=1168545 RepID=A0A6G1IDQ4_9PLEO|nr:hypothetical protein K458DRAFT_469585 [Lentithecium fluviatile CBS 122367]